MPCSRTRRYPRVVVGCPAPPRTARCHPGEGRGEPTAVGAAPAQLRAAEWAQEATKPPSGEVELRHEPQRGVFCHKFRVDRGRCSLRVAVVEHLVPFLTVAVRAVGPGAHGHERSGQAQEYPSTTSRSIEVSRSSELARLPRRSTRMIPPGVNWEIQAGGMWSVAAVAMIRSNGAAAASPAAPSPACTAEDNPSPASAGGLCRPNLGRAPRSPRSVP